MFSGLGIVLIVSYYWNNEQSLTEISVCHCWYTIPTVMNIYTTQRVTPTEFMSVQITFAYYIASIPIHLICL